MNKKFFSSTFYFLLFTFFCGSLSAQGVGKNISQFPAASALTGGELVPIWQGAATKKLLLGNAATLNIGTTANSVAAGNRVAQVFVPVYVSSTTDATAAIQAALDLASAAGGGIVQLESKAYLLPYASGGITIPDSVTLRGNEVGARDTKTHVDIGVRTDSGTQLILAGGAGGTDTQTAWIAMGHNSTLQGVRLFDPDQNKDSGTPVAKPFAVRQPYLIHGVSVLSVNLVNIYRGVDVQYEQTLLRDITGNPIRAGIRVDFSIDVCRIESCIFVPTWSFGHALQGWIDVNGVGFEIRRADQIIMSNCFTFSYGRGLLTQNSTMTGAEGTSCYGTFTNCGFDNSMVDIQAAAATGLEFLGCSFAKNGVAVNLAHSSGSVKITGGRAWAGAQFLVSSTGASAIQGIQGYVSRVLVTGNAFLSILGNRFGGNGSPNISITATGAYGEVKDNYNASIGNASPGVFAPKFNLADLSAATSKGSVSQTIPTATATTLTWSATEWDESSLLTSTGVTAPVTGHMVFRASALWYLPGGTNVALMLYKNGSPLKDLGRAVVPGSGLVNYQQTGEVEVVAIATDVFSIRVTQDSGASQLVDGSVARTWFQCAYTK